jgi:hypothetical protein
MVFSWVDIRVFFFSGLIMSTRHQLSSKTGTLGHQRIPIVTLETIVFRFVRDGSSRRSLGGNEKCRNTGMRLKKKLVWCRPTGQKTILTPQ